MKTFRVAAGVKDVRLSVRAASAIPTNYYGKTKRDTLRRIALMQGLHTCIRMVRAESGSDKSPDPARKQRLAWLEAFMTYYMLIDSGVPPGFTPSHPGPGLIDIATGDVVMD
eukprot:jgi/Mesvir1/19481/Mv20209-RA.1